ncbi:MAG: hypothetical protein AAFV45_06380 [Pseudomonadota bacterium]
MSTIRIVALTAILVTIVPHDAQRREALLTSTGENVEWALSTCQRHAETCETLKQSSLEITEKVERTVMMKAALIRQAVIDNSPALENTDTDASLSRITVVPPMQTTFAAPPPKTNAASLENDGSTSSVDQGTLAATDLVPAWSIAPKAR